MFFLIQLSENFLPFTGCLPDKAPCYNSSGISAWTQSKSLKSSLISSFQSLRETPCHSYKDIARFLSFRLVRNPSDYVAVQVPHRRINLFDKLYLSLPAHIFYLLLPDNRTEAIIAKLIIDKSVQTVFGRKTARIEVVFMLIDSSCEIVCYPDIKSRPGISHNIHYKTSKHN